MKATRILLTGFAFLAAQFTLSAAVTLTLENPGTLSYQQTDNSPCVIGDPSCKNPAGFGSTIITQTPPPPYDYDETSPTYTVQQIRDIVGNLFFVGIDINTTTSPLATEKLDLFTAS